MASLVGTFPSSLGGLLRLRVLHIMSKTSLYTMNFEGTIPSSFFDLTSLESLRLIDTGLQDFESVKSPSLMPNLTVVSFAGSSSFLDDLSDLLPNAPNLEILDLSGTFVSDITSLTRFSKLTHLALNDCLQLKIDFQDEFWQSKPLLQSFSVKGTSGASGTLSKSLGLLTHLRTLDLSSSTFSGPLPAEIGLCPLEELVLSSSLISLPLPDAIAHLNDTLLHLEARNMFPTALPLPSSIGALKRLEALHLGSCGYIGTIPAAYGLLPDLHTLSLENNELHGQIPELAFNMSFLDLHNNRLNGSLPRSVVEHSTTLYLQYNLISFSEDREIFVNAPKLTDVNLSHNDFSGPLPALHPTTPPVSLAFSYNRFNGSVPASYCGPSSLRLDNNELTGSISNLIDWNCNSQLASLYLYNNKFSGTISGLTQLRSLVTLSVSHNDFEGLLPELPMSLLRFEAANCHFTLTNQWAAAPNSLVSLDISSNHFEYFSSFVNIVFPTLEHLSVANNYFGAVFPPLEHHSAAPNLTSLDVSNISLSGNFPSSSFPNLQVLKAANNSLSGSIPDFYIMKSLSQLDISNNKYRFDVTSFTTLPYLTLLDAHSNNLYGTVILDNMPNLRSMDLSANDLNLPPDFASIGASFSNGPLLFLNISKNPNLRPIRSFNSQKTGLGRSHTSSPSANSSELVTCYDLEFYNTSGRTFIFDEPLFNYLQCDCSAGSFGEPPIECFPCPTLGTLSCGGPEAVIKKGFFAYSSDKPMRLSTLPAPEATGFERLRASFSALTALLKSGNGLVKVQTNATKPGAPLKLDTESCLVTTLQILSGDSNCLGIHVDAAHLHNASSSSSLETQCATGSEGRLCSKCQCDVEKDGFCYFEKGPICARCTRVVPFSTAIALALSLVFVIVVVLSIIFFFFLRSKRLRSLKPWSELPLHKRIFYRLLLLSSLGNLSILITFLQMLIEFTQWDVYAKVEFLSFLNGGLKGFGLECLFPFFARPLPALLARLFLPFLLIGLVFICAAIANLAINLVEARKRKQAADDQDVAASSENTALLLNQASEEVVVHYPALALTSSLSISVLKFFYFGTAIAAHEYLFSTSQPFTHIKYVQNKPWMPFSEAKTLIAASIPAIFVFDLGIPLAFVVVCWKFRRTFNQPHIKIYFGSLFDSFGPKCFWWELVLLLRKLTVALILQALPASDAIQGALAVSVLAGTQVLQVALNPWRRSRSENLADTISSLLLIGALMSTRPGHLSHVTAVVYYIFMLSVIFVIGSVVLIIYRAVTDVTDYEIFLHNGYKTQPHALQHEGATSDGWLLSEADRSLN